MTSRPNPVAGPRRGPATGARPAASLAGLLGLVLLTGCGAAGETAAPPPPATGLPSPHSGAPTDPVTGGGQSGGSGDPALPGDNPVTPQPVRSGRPLAWSTALPTGDGTALEVRFGLGPPPCSVLGAVRTAESADHGDGDTLSVGQQPGADCSGPQPAIAFPAVTTVRLAAPLAGRTVVDGAR